MTEMAGIVEAVGAVHGRAVFGRRVRVLVEAIERLLPREVESLADVGCGDGSIGAALIARRGGLRYEGFELMARPAARVPVTTFDGRTLPLPDRAVDAVLFVDVLHHASDPGALLSEAARVSRRWVLVKDHLADRLGARPTLAFMDWVGNRPHGVAMRGEYWTRSRWDEAWRAAGLTPVASVHRLGLYPAPAAPLFEWGLHHLTLLERSVGSAGG